MTLYLSQNRVPFLPRRYPTSITGHVPAIFFLASHFSLFVILSCSKFLFKALNAKVSGYSYGGWPKASFHGLDSFEKSVFEVSRLLPAPTCMRMSELML